MIIPPLLVFATALAALGLVGSLITAVYRLSVRVQALESFRDGLGRLQGARMRAKADALKRLE